MAVKWISTNWEDDLKTRVAPTDRIYLDFRQEIYPPITGGFGRGSITEGIKIGDLVVGITT